MFLFKSRFLLYVLHVKNQQKDLSLNFVQNEKSNKTNHIKGKISSREQMKQALDKIRCSFKKDKDSLRKRISDLQGVLITSQRPLEHHHLLFME